MNRIEQIITILVLLSGFHLNTAANETVTPPDNAERETWMMTYNDYKFLLNTRDDQYINLTREVTVVKDGNVMYFQGIFSELPDSWIKGTIRDDRLIFDQCQILSVIDNSPIYFINGYMELRYTFSPYDYTEYTGTLVAFCYGLDESVFTISDNGDTIKSEVEKTHSLSTRALRPVFWYSTDPGWLYVTIDKNFSGWKYNHTPDLDFPACVSFHQVR